MPIYEYCCVKCKHVFEEWIKDFDTSECAECPLCNGNAERMLSNTSFILKGGGWYVTEYGNQKKDVQQPSETKADSAKESNIASDTTAKDTTSTKPLVNKDTKKIPVPKVESKNTSISTTT